MAKRKWNLYYMNEDEIIASKSRKEAIEFSEFVVGPEETQVFFDGLVEKDLTCSIPMSHLKEGEIDILKEKYQALPMGNSFIIQAYAWLDYVVSVEEPKENAFIILSKL